MPSRPCTDSDSARPATLSSATSEAVGMPSSPAMMITAMTHSAIFTAESRKFFMVRPIFFAPFRARETILRMTLMTTRQMRKVMSAPKSVLSGIVPM